MAWKEGSMGNFPRGGGTFKGAALPHVPRVAKAVVRTSSGAYRERGGHLKAKGEGTRGRPSARSSLRMNSKTKARTVL